MISLARVSPEVSECSGGRFRTAAEAGIGSSAGVADETGELEGAAESGWLCSNSRAASVWPKCDSKTSRAPRNRREAPHPISRYEKSLFSSPLRIASTLFPGARRILTVVQRYRLRRRTVPTPESAPPPSSIISQPADVAGILFREVPAEVAAEVVAF